jgi:hypothetical protein
MPKRKRPFKKNIKIPREIAIEIENFLENISDVQWDQTIKDAIEHRWSLPDFMECTVGRALTLSWYLYPGKFADPEEYILHTILMSTEPEQFEQLDHSLWLY